MYAISHLIEFSSREPSGAVSVVIVDVHCEMIKILCLLSFICENYWIQERNYPSQGYIFCFSRHWLLNLKKRKKHKHREIFCLPFWSSIQSQNQPLGSLHKKVSFSFSYNLLNTQINCVNWIILLIKSKQYK